METTKLLYKDLIRVAKDDDTGDIKPVSWAFRITNLKTASGNVMPSGNDHSQSFLYVLVDPMNWHVNVF